MSTSGFPNHPSTEPCVTLGGVCAVQNKQIIPAWCWNPYNLRKSKENPFLKKKNTLICILIIQSNIFKKNKVRTRMKTLFLKVISYIKDPFT